MKKIMICFLLLFALQIHTVCNDTAAGVKIVSSKNPDASSVEAVLKEILKPGMSNQEKAEAIFRYLVTHFYHFDAPEEVNADMLQARKANHEISMIVDSVKQLNVYAHGLCGSQSKISNQFYNAAGFLSRVCGVQGHTTFEVKYDGSWHYFDVDMMGFVRDTHGKVVSIDDIKADKNLILKKHAKTPEYYFKFDGPQAMFNCLSQGVRFAMYGRKMGIHSMNLFLTEGEEFTRYFQRQWGPEYRYFCPPRKNNYSKSLIRMKEGPERDKAHYLFTEAGAKRYGNWERSYTADLTKKTFVDSAYQNVNTKSNSAKPFVGSAASGPSEIVLNVYSPYGCAGVANDLSTNDDDKKGYILSGEFNTDNGDLLYSFDLGKTWVSAHTGGKAFEVDLTPHFVSRYGWLIKIKFEGAKAGLNSFKSYLSGQLSPASLPFVDGKTDMAFTRSETDCILLQPDLGISEENAKLVAHELTDLAWSESAIGHLTGNGSIVYKVDAPGEIVRVQAGAKFNGRKGTYQVEFSADNGVTWVLAAKQKSVYNETHSEEFWGQSLEGILDFEMKKAYSPGCIRIPGNVWETDFVPTATKSILVKFSQRGGSLCQVYGIYTHYKKESKEGLQITHKWNGGEHVEDIAAGLNSKKYTVDGGSIDKNLFISIKSGK